MYEIHPEYKKSRTNHFNKKKQRKHEHTSSESSLDRYDNFTRKRIIQRWNDDAFAEKKTKERRKRFEQPRINFSFIEKKSYKEDSKKKYYKKEEKKKKCCDSDDDETKIQNISTQI